MNPRLSPRRGARGLVVLAGAAIVGLASISSCAALSPSPAPSAATPRSPSAAAPTPNPANSWLTPDGIARAVWFRKSFGLRADDDWIRLVANDPRALANVVNFSIPMTDIELADFRARMADREAVLSDLEQFRTAHLETWGGYYFNADRLVVWLIDPSGSIEKELRAAVPSPFLVNQARWSLQELDALAERIVDDGWLQAHYHLLSGGADTDHNTVAIEVSSADRAAPADIARHFGLGDELTVTIDGTGVATLPKGSITGRAVDAAGRPAAGLDIELAPDIPGADTGEIGRSTGADGSFEIGDIPAIGYVIRLVVGPDTTRVPNASPGIQVGQARVVVKAGQTTEIRVIVVWP